MGSVSAKISLKKSGNMMESTLQHALISPQVKKAINHLEINLQLEVKKGIFRLLIFKRKNV